MDVTKIILIVKEDTCEVCYFALNSSSDLNSLKAL
jgi:hypothetical protein